MGHAGPQYTEGVARECSAPLPVTRERAVSGVPGVWASQCAVPADGVRRPPELRIGPRLRSALCIRCPVHVFWGVAQSPWPYKKWGCRRGCPTDDAGGEADGAWGVCLAYVAIGAGDREGRQHSGHSEGRCAGGSDRLRAGVPTAGGVAADADAWLCVIAILPPPNIHPASGPQEEGRPEMEHVARPNASRPVIKIPTGDLGTVRCAVEGVWRTAGLRSEGGGGGAGGCKGLCEGGRRGGGGRLGGCKGPRTISP